MQVFHKIMPQYLIRTSVLRTAFLAESFENQVIRLHVEPIGIVKVLQEWGYFIQLYG